MLDLLQLVHSVHCAISARISTLPSHDMLLLQGSRGNDTNMLTLQMQLKSASNGGLPILTKFTTEERREKIEVQPLWVVVHQETPDGVARCLTTQALAHSCML